MEEKIIESVVVPRPPAPPKADARTKKQHRPRAAKNLEMLTKSFSDAVSSQQGEKDALKAVIREMTEKIKDKEKETFRNSDEHHPNIHGFGVRYGHEGFDGSPFYCILFYSAPLLICCFSFMFCSTALRWIVFGTVCIATVSLRHVIYNVYTQNAVPLFFEASMKPADLPYEEIIDRTCNNIYVRPFDSVPWSTLACAIHRFCAMIVCYEEGRPSYRNLLCVPMCAGYHTILDKDERMSNQRANKHVTDRVLLTVYACFNLDTGLSTQIVVCDDICNQVAIRIRDLPEKDRRLQSNSMASRVTNHVICAKWFAECSRGSARMAHILASNETMSDSVFNSTNTFQLSAPWSVMFFVLFSILPLVIRAQSGSIYQSPLSDEQVVLLVLISAVIEELIKSTATSLTGISRHKVSLFFGLVEWQLGGCLADGVPALLMHYIVGFMSTRWAILTHLAFNGSVLSANFIVLFIRDYLRRQALLIKLLPSEPFVHPGADPITSVVVFLGCLLSVSYRFERLVRLFAVGYRVSEVSLPEVGKHGAKITRFPSFYLPSLRTSASCTLGFALKYIAPVFPDFNHGPSALRGCLMRFCRNPPTVTRRRLRSIARFTRSYVRRHYQPIASDADVSIDTWLASTNYTEARKNELRRVWNDCETICERDLEVAGFIKRESYEVYKPPRGINSRGDRFKCATGPFFKIMESQVYHQPCFDGYTLTLDPSMMGPFIKHIPIHLRPKFIDTYLGLYPGRYYETDYSQFEKHFVPQVMDSIEMILYRHMLRNFPATYNLIHDTMCGQNKCVYKHFLIKIFGRRMSGEMCTSLGNGFANLILFTYVAHTKGGTACGVVEGDDALFYSSVELSSKDFRQLGFDIKILIHSDLRRTCFCGMMMSRTCALLRDPRKVLLKFGWTFSPFRNCSTKVRLGLLRAKALALAYECPCCPILHALAKRVCAYTAGITPRYDQSFWHREQEMNIAKFSAQTLEKLRTGPSIEDRLDFHDIFNISTDCQLEVESRIANWDGNPLDDPLINSLFDHEDCRMFYEKYVATSEQTAMGLAGDA